MELDLLSPTDKPALLALTDSTAASDCRQALAELGFKVHAATSHSDFLQRFAQTQYQVVMIDEKFGGGGGTGDVSLVTLQNMPMNQRRHATVFLLGGSFQSLHPMQAFQQSVHAVVNASDLKSLGPILQKVIADNELFLSAFRDSQTQLAKGK